jgi:hypothetical protein
VQMQAHRQVGRVGACARHVCWAAGAHARSLACSAAAHTRT